MKNTTRYLWVFFGFLMVWLVYHNIEKYLSPTVNEATVHYNIAHCAAIKGKKVNWRAGPGLGHPIICVMTLPPAAKIGRWPVLILREKDHWYWVRDIEGTSGWINGTMLSFSPFLLVREPGTFIYAKANKRNALAYARPGVILLWKKAGPRGWCKVSRPHSSIQGWVPITALWPPLG